jgi:nucleoside-diphosphate-sugar epimerase
MSSPNGSVKLSSPRRFVVRPWAYDVALDGFGRLVPLGKERETPYGIAMRVLVTGATGKVGSRLARRLAFRGDQIRALVRDPGRASELRERHAEVMRGDLLDHGSLEAAVDGVQAVVHCAALFFPGTTSEQAHAINGLGTQRLAELARAAGAKRFVFISTGLVYGGNGGRLACEDDPCSPSPGYFAGRLAAERTLLAVDGLDVRILRLALVYGDGDPHIEEIVPRMRGFPPGRHISIVHHADVARAVALVLDAPSPSHRIYNVVDDEAPDLTTLFASVGAPPPDGSAAEAGQADNVLLDGRRLREDLGFKPQYPRLRDAIAAGA